MLTSLQGAAYIISISIYRLFFHPISRFPGPRHAALTDFTYIYWFVKGDLVQWTNKMHQQYGEVVRLGPDRLSYTSPEAWKDIYGHKTVNRKSNRKDSRFFGPTINGIHPLVSEPSDAEHARQRKIFSNAFSDRALGLQEGLIQKYVHQLVDLVRRKISEGPDGKSVEADVVQLYNFTTFDIMGDLTFGEPLGNLDRGEYSPWVQAVFGGFKSLMIQNLFHSYPFFRAVWGVATPKTLKHEAAVHWQNCVDRVTKRLSMGADARPDIWGLVLKHKDAGKEISRPQMDANAQLFMTAGTETTATALTGLTWLLMHNRDKYNRLIEEIRSVPDESELTFDRLRHMKYLVACIEEGLRCRLSLSTINL